MAAHLGCAAIFMRGVWPPVMARPPVMAPVMPDRHTPVTALQHRPAKEAADGRAVKLSREFTTFSRIYIAPIPFDCTRLRAPGEKQDGRGKYFIAAR